MWFSFILFLSFSAIALTCALCGNIEAYLKKYPVEYDNSVQEASTHLSEVRRSYNNLKYELTQEEKNLTEYHVRILSYPVVYDHNIQDTLLERIVKYERDVKLLKEQFHKEETELHDKNRIILHPSEMLVTLAEEQYQNSITDCLKQYYGSFYSTILLMGILGELGNLLCMFIIPLGYLQMACTHQ